MSLVAARGDSTSNRRLRRPTWIAEPTPGTCRATLSVPGIRCAGCIAKIENSFNSLAGIQSARVNLSTKRVTIHFDEGTVSAEQLLDHMESLGFSAQPYTSSGADDTADKRELNQLLWALAVSGFAAANVMLLSISVWSGATSTTRDLFHWISALIALPAVVYAGQPFYQSAWASLKKFRLNMDVPISLAVVLAAGMSLYEVMSGGEETYFDASVMLLFFLLIGRTLDHMMRARARSAVADLIRLTPAEATIITEAGERETIPLEDVEPGMTVWVQTGTRIPVDGEIASGKSDVDRSLVTGESAPELVQPGDKIFAGVMNLSAPLTVKVTAAQDNTLLSEIVRLMEAAEQSKARYVRLASKAAEIYAPLVHILAAATFIGWMVHTGGDWHQSLFIGISVLIITCPCALGLAVPVVQIVASGELFRRGVMVKDGAALEKLAELNWVLFDKTGTLTMGDPQLIDPQSFSVRDISLAAGLGEGSNHPLSQAIVTFAKQSGVTPAKVEEVSEVPGCGLQGIWQCKSVRLGKRAWCIQDTPSDGLGTSPNGFLELSLAEEGTELSLFSFEDALRPDAKEVVSALHHKGYGVEIVSGDREDAVTAAAKSIGIERLHAGLLPQEKLTYLKELEASGKKVFMVGDGLNDAPALAAAHVSMAPSSASDIGRTAADFVFLGAKLAPVIEAMDTAKFARSLVHQNFALAALYNLIAVPIAIAGFASPLVAAIAMSTSSLIVTVNALRLRLRSSFSAPTR